MKQSLALRFDRIIKENLPKRSEMIVVLKENPIPTNLFFEKGMGVKSILKKTGRLTDFKGIYCFIEKGKIVYIDESSYVIRRLVRQFKGNSKYQRKLAQIMVDMHKESQPFYTESNALGAMKKMQIMFMDLPDDLERQITTLYLQCQYECTYNHFE